MEFIEDIMKVINPHVQKKVDLAIADIPIRVFDNNTGFELDIVSEVRDDGEVWLKVEKGDR